jgi:hypothetical protein
MMRLRRASAIAALCVLASAATASAECAWVLWASASILTAPEKPREAWPDGAFPIRAECDAGRDRMFAGMLTSNTPGITVTRLGELIAIMTNEPPRPGPGPSFRRPHTSR